MMRRLWTLPTVFVLACTVAKPANAPPTDSDAKEPEAPWAEEAASESTPPSGSEPVDLPAPKSPAASAPAETRGPGVAAVCEDLCVRVAKACTAAEAGACRKRCEKYVADEANCGDEIKEALQCQAQAQPHTLCLPVADAACTPKFQRISSCRKGEAPPKEEVSTGSSPAVAGWQRVTLDQLGVSSLMPPGSKVDAGNRQAYRGDHENVAYYFASQPPPSGGLDERAVVRMVLAYVGTQCQRDLRVFGRYETGPRTSVRFATKCHDGATREGMLHIWPNKCAVVSFHAPAGVDGVTDPLFFSFEAK